MGDRNDHKKRWHRDHRRDHHVVVILFLAGVIKF